jgi:hypothetical protein
VGEVTVVRGPISGSHLIRAPVDMDLHV